MKPDELRNLAKKRFGENWHDELAKEIPCHVRTVMRWDQGKHPIGAVMANRVKDICNKPKRK